MGKKKTKVESTIPKKNKRAKEMDVIVNVSYNDDDDDVLVEIYLSDLIEPQMRPRVSGLKIYDPLATYKKIIRDKIKKELEKTDIKIPISPENIKIVSSIYLYKEPPTGWSIGKKYRALIGEIPFNVKPDIDNCVKCLYDTFEGIFFYNDSQIIKETLKKQYDTTDHTYIKFKISKIQSATKKYTIKSILEECKEPKIREYIKNIEEERKNNK